MIRVNGHGRYGVVAFLILLFALALLLAVSAACAGEDEVEPPAAVQQAGSGSGQQASASGSADRTEPETKPAPTRDSGREEPSQESQPTAAEDDLAPAPPATEMTEITETTDVAEALPSTVERIRKRGALRCGVKLTQPLFSFQDETGSISGFDIDFCKAIQAALGEEIGLELIDASDAITRFERLLGGEFDLLIRTTTYTASRDRELGLEFSTPTFHSGLGFAVRRDSGVTEIAQMEQPTICTPASAVVSRILAERLAALGLSYTELPLDFEDYYETFFAGGCDVLAGDVSAVASAISVRPEAEEFTILPQVISKEPIAIVVREDDPEWADLVNWVVRGLIAAEEEGITRQNVAMVAAHPPNTTIARLLGVSYEGGEVSTLGFDAVGAQFIQRAIAAVGSYGELYERHLGGVLDRHCTLNALASEDKSDCPPGSGGVMYAHPYR